MKSLSGSEFILGVAAGPSVGNARFKLVLPLPIAAGVVVSGGVALVRAWTARAVP